MSEYRVAIRYNRVTTYEPARTLADARDVWRGFVPHMRVRKGRTWIERRVKAGPWQRVP
jgi:hypothetical protein